MDDVYIPMIEELQRYQLAASMRVKSPWTRRTAREQANDAIDRELGDILKPFGVVNE